MFLNLKTWEKLPKNLQDVIIEVMITIEKDGLIRDMDQAKSDWDKLISAGLETTNLIESDIQKYTTVYNSASWERLKKINLAEYQKMRKLAKIGEGVAGIKF